METILAAKNLVKEMAVKCSCPAKSFRLHVSYEVANAMMTEMKEVGQSCTITQISGVPIYSSMKFEKPMEVIHEVCSSHPSYAIAESPTLLKINTMLKKTMSCGCPPKLFEVRLTPETHLAIRAELSETSFGAIKDLKYFFGGASVLIFGYEDVINHVPWCEGNSSLDGESFLLDSIKSHVKKEMACGCSPKDFIVRFSAEGYERTRIEASKMYPGKSLFDVLGVSAVERVPGYWMLYQVVHTSWCAKTHAPGMKDAIENHAATKFLDEYEQPSFQHQSFSFSWKEFQKKKSAYSHTFALSKHDEESLKEYYTKQIASAYGLKSSDLTKPSHKCSTCRDKGGWFEDVEDGEFLVAVYKECDACE